ncbi:MAG: hypothetical protein KJ607_06860, partial [Bacteroidetes bacterium]|nr:hypothetical protein [Bacteroidota bacterium]
DLVEVSVDEDIVSTKSGGSKSGFAVGGFSTSKGESTYMEVNETDASFYVELLQQFTQNKKAMDETIENQQEIISKLTLANTQKEEEINLLKTELQEIKNMLEK